MSSAKRRSSTDSRFGRLLNWSPNRVPNNNPQTPEDGKWEEKATVGENIVALKSDSEPLIPYVAVARTEDKMLVADFPSKNRTKYSDHIRTYLVGDLSKEQQDLVIRAPCIVTMINASCSRMVTKEFVYFAVHSDRLPENYANRFILNLSTGFRQKARSIAIKARGSDEFVVSNRTAFLKFAQLLVENTGQEQAKQEMQLINEIGCKDALEGVQKKVDEAKAVVIKAIDAELEVVETTERIRERMNFLVQSSKQMEDAAGMLRSKSEAENFSYQARLGLIGFSLLVLFILVLLR